MALRARQTLLDGLDAVQKLGSLTRSISSTKRARLRQRCRLELLVAIPVAERELQGPFASMRSVSRCPDPCSRTVTLTLLSNTCFTTTIPNHFHSSRWGCATPTRPAQLRICCSPVDAPPPCGRDVAQESFRPSSSREQSFRGVFRAYVLERASAGRSTLPWLALSWTEPPRSRTPGPPPVIRTTSISPSLRQNTPFPDSARFAPPGSRTCRIARRLSRSACSGRSPISEGA